MLSKKEVSSYLVSIFILNLICTVSFDWISKAILRFYAKYNYQKRLKEFISTILGVSTFLYLAILLLYLLFSNIITVQLGISNSILILVVLLVIPCGLRQSLYQILRLKNNYSLYTLSIAMYQILFIVFFLALVQMIQNAVAIIVSMFIAITIIDIYILKKQREEFDIGLAINKQICNEILCYSLPLVFTNIMYWLVLYVPNMLYQHFHQYSNSAIFGVALLIINNTLQPLAGLFNFINFPKIVKNYEFNKGIDIYHTSTIQLYLLVCLPIVLGISYFSYDIARVFMPASYSAVGIVLPYIAFKIFLHELLKLITIKYHLKNTTYIELLIAAIIVGTAILMNIKFIMTSSIMIIAIIVLATEICLVIANIFVKRKDINYIDYKKIIKTLPWILIVSMISFLSVIVLCRYSNYFMSIFRIFLYFIINYIVLYLLRKKILV